MYVGIRKMLSVLPFVIIFFLSLFPRAVEIINKNYVFGLDQGRDYLAIRDIVVNKKLTLIGPELGNGYSGISYVFHGPFYYYLLSVPFLIFGGDPYGGIVLMFLFGIGSVVLAYFIGKKLYGRMGGIVFSLLMAISPPLISQSRFTWNPHAGTLFILLSILFILQINKSKKYIFLSALCCAFTYNFDLGIAAVLCISLLLYAVIVLRIKSWQNYVLLLGGFILGFAPMIIFELRHGFHGIENVIQYMKKPESFPQKNYSLNHIQTILYVIKDTFPKQNFFNSDIGIGMIAAFFGYLLLKEKNLKRKHILQFFLILPITVFLVFLPLKNAIYPHYLTELQIVAIVAVMYIICASWEKNKIIFIISSIFLLFMTVIGIQSAIITTRSDIKDFGGDKKINGLKEVVDYIYNDAHNEPFGIYEFSPAVLTDRYDYMFLWYGKKKFGYIPYKDKRGLVYFLIEVDKAKPWSYKGWLETVIKDGLVLDTHELESGFIVQKRKFLEK